MTIKFVKLPNIVESALRLIKIFCLNHSTCENCPFRADKLGCMFRYMTPREYDINVEE